MYAVCQDMRGATDEPTTTKVKAELGGADERAEGLVAHVAGPVEGGFRIIDTWESRAAAEAFWTEHLEPAVARAHGERGAEMRDAVPAGSRSASDRSAQPSSYDERELAEADDAERDPGPRAERSATGCRAPRRWPGTPQ